MQCWFWNDATKLKVIDNRICEGTDYLLAVLRSGMTSLQVMVSFGKLWAGGAMKQRHCCISYLDQAVWHPEWKHSIWNIQIITAEQNLNVADSSLLPLLFLRSLSILWIYMYIVSHNSSREHRALTKFRHLTRLLACTLLHSMFCLGV